MIDQNHAVPTEPLETVEFDLDEWCKEAAAALTRKIDEAVLACLMNIDTTSGTSTNSPSTKPLSHGDVTRMIESLQLLSTPLRSTFDASASKLRLEYMFGLTVRPSDQASAVLQLPSV